ncbi:uncharacterized protein WM294_001123 [Sarcoramphus papa]
MLLTGKQKQVTPLGLRKRRWNPSYSESILCTPGTAEGRCAQKKAVSRQKRLKRLEDIWGPLPPNLSPPQKVSAASSRQIKHCKRKKRTSCLGSLWNVKVKSRHSNTASLEAEQSRGFLTGFRKKPKPASDGDRNPLLNPKRQDPGCLLHCSSMASSTTSVLQIPSKP